MRTRSRGSRPRARLLSLLRRLFRRDAREVLERPAIALPLRASANTAKPPSLFAPDEGVHGSEPASALTVRGVYWLLTMYPGAPIEELLDHYCRLLRAEQYPESQVEHRLEQIRGLLSKALRAPSSPLEKP